MRCFVGIRLGADVEAAATRVIQRLAACGQGVRWVRRENMHLTLRFLGELEVTDIEEVQSALAAVEARSFALSLGRLGRFPERGRPRVVWMGVDGDTSGLGELFSGVDAALRAIGMPGEAREFRPHLTLGRVRDLRADWLGAALDSVGVPPASAAVREFALFESRLGSDGPRYRAVATFPLA